MEEYQSFDFGNLEDEFLKCQDALKKSRALSTERRRNLKKEKKLFERSLRDSRHYYPVEVKEPKKKAQRSAIQRGNVGVGNKRTMKLAKRKRAPRRKMSMDRSVRGGGKRKPRNQRHSVRKRGVRSRSSLGVRVKKNKSFGGLYSFNPRIRKGKKLSKGHRGSKSLWDHLSGSKKGYYSALKKVKKKKDRKFMRANCPFKPSISAIHHKKRKLRRKSYDDVFHFLHTADSEREAYLAREAREQEEAYLEKNCPFKPTVRKSSEAYQKLAREGYQPLNERVDAVIRDRKAMLRRLRAERQALEIPEGAFAPKMNERSKRLYARAVRARALRKYQVEQRIINLEKEFQKAHPFRPKLSGESERIVEANEKLAGRKFSDRLDVYSEMQQKRAKERELLDGVGGDQYQKKQKRAISKDYIQKLALVDPKKREILVKYLRKKYSKPLSFKPKLSSRSKRYGKHTPLEELVYNTRREKNMQKLAKEVERDEGAECSFRPRLVANQYIFAEDNKYRLLNDPGAVMPKVEMLREAKRQVVERLRSEREARVMQECTFRPKLVSKAGERRVQRMIAGEEEPVEVAGFGRFMQKVELARDLKAERLRREEEAFKVKAPLKMRKGKGKKKKKGLNYTTFTPFGFKERDIAETSKMLNSLRADEEFDESRLFV